MKNRYRYSASTMLICILLSACVTINIYFPAAAAERAADEIIKKVWQLDNDDLKEELDRGNHDE